MIRPDYYSTNGKDLFALMQEGLLTEAEFRGFMKGNAFKYVKRYDQKNGLEDLDKAITYLTVLREHEAARSKPKNPSGEAMAVVGRAFSSNTLSEPEHKPRKEDKYNDKRPTHQHVKG